MSRQRHAPEALRRPRRIYLSPRELEVLAPHVKGHDFSEWARERLLASLREEMPAAIAAAADVEPPAKEMLQLPPWGEADGDGLRYAWRPRSASVGTLTIETPRGRLEIDLTSPEVIESASGVELRFSDRSLVREVREGEGE